jgi:tRNA-binding protein
MTPVPVKPLIAPDVLEKIDVRVGTIESVDEVPNSDKLLALRVNFGDHKRTILSAMKQERIHYREIEGKQALFVVNLEPRKMRGMVSEGMLFDIGYADGVKPALAMPEHPVPDGSRAG